MSKPFAVASARRGYTRIRHSTRRPEHSRPGNFLAPPAIPKTQRPESQRLRWSSDYLMTDRSLRMTVSSVFCKAAPWGACPKSGCGLVLLTVVLSVASWGDGLAGGCRHAIRCCMSDRRRNVRKSMLYVADFLSRRWRRWGRRHFGREALGRGNWWES